LFRKQKSQRRVSFIENLKPDILTLVKTRHFNFGLTVKLKIDDLNKNKRFIENIRMLQPPIRSAKAIAPKKKHNLAVAAALGLMLGAFIAFFREFWINSAGEEEEKS
jgi:LPS O-antigen subunit length determinant protein (WzzB/FepE family)